MSFGGGSRIRCGCGQFVREDGIDAHVSRCPCIRAAADDERERIESTFG